MQKIERLSLSSNNIKSLPDEIGACSELKELYISNCAKLSSFPGINVIIVIIIIIIITNIIIIIIMIGTAGHLRKLQELSLRKCPALKQFPATAIEMESLRELDLRAMKKEVCKIDSDVVDALVSRNCTIRGGVVKKAKGKKK